MKEGIPSFKSVDCFILELFAKKNIYPKLLLFYLFLPRGGGGALPRLGGILRRVMLKKIPEEVPTRPYFLRVLFGIIHRDSTNKNRAVI